MKQPIDDKDALRRAHLKRLEASHQDDFEERFQTEKTRRQVKKEALSDAISAHWNKTKYLGTAASAGGTDEPKALPEGWRDLHWKQIVVMAKDVAGVDAANKDEAVAALEEYEAG